MIIPLGPLIAPRTAVVGVLLELPQKKLHPLTQVLMTSSRKRKGEFL